MHCDKLSTLYKSAPPLLRFAPRRGILTTNPVEVSNMYQFSFVRFSSYDAFRHGFAVVRA